MTKNIIPNQDIIKNNIDLIKKMDLINCDIEDLKAIIREIIIGIRFRANIFHPGFKLYRGRKCTIKPSNINELSYPPPNFITSFQRVNRPGDSFFYCSTAREVPFFELDLKPGDFIALSTWKTKEKLLLNNIGYTSNSLRRLNSNKITHKLEQDRKREKNRSPIDETVYEFLSDQFSQYVNDEEDYYYKISIAIAEELMYSKSKEAINLDGLIYPTMMMNANADNIAINRNYITDEKIEMKKVEYIRIEERKNMTIKYNVLDYANSVNQKGMIEWKGHGPKWVMRKDYDLLHIEYKNGEFIAYDKEGNIREPE